MQGREGAARYPLCSRNARPQQALVGRAQLRATLATPFNTRKREEREGKTRKDSLRFPVLAQRAVADSPRWTRARWEPTRPPLPTRKERGKKQLIGCAHIRNGPNRPKKVECHRYSSQALYAQLPEGAQSAIEARDASKA